MLEAKDIHIAFLGQSIFITRGDREEAKRLLDKEEMKDSCDGVTVTHKNLPIIYIDDWKNLGLVLHELTHAILTICWTRGLYIDTEPVGQEWFCYLIEHVFAEAIKEEDWHNIKVIGKFNYEDYKTRRPRTRKRTKQIGKEKARGKTKR